MGVEERVAQIIVEQLAVHEDQITRQVRFVEDLGADSRDIVELICKEFKIGIPGEEAAKITTVGQAIEYIEAHEQGHFPSNPEESVGGSGPSG